MAPPFHAGLGCDLIAGHRHEPSVPAERAAEAVAVREELAARSM
ncbi:hypothetical protein AB0D97_25410 [Streptomyces roseus]